MKDRRYYLEILLVSMAVILIEIGYTRVFSYKLFYYFTYLIIGISLLGIGAGGVFVAIFPRLRRLGPERLIPLCSALASLTVLVGYFVVAYTQLNAVLLDQRLVEVAKLVLVCGFLFTPFMLTGIVIATIFCARPDAINRLYFADLIGAGLGCAACVPLMYAVTPPGTVWLSGFVFAVASLPMAWKHNRGLLAVSVPLAAILLGGALMPHRLPDPVPDVLKTMSPQQLQDRPVRFSSWSPVFRIDLLDFPMEGGGYLISHDGTMGSTLHHFDGDLTTLKRFQNDLRQYAYRVLAKKDPEVLIIGAAGGHEILAALYFGAKHVTGVELNPVTHSLLTTHFADFTGRLPENPRVSYLNDEGRSFLQRDQTKYDLILFVAPDSYSAMNAATSGAFVLSESYLYTTEMIMESLNHLKKDGILCMDFGELNFERKPNRTTRYLGTAREAFRRLGIEDFGNHVLLSTSPSILQDSTTLLKRTPFEPEEVERFIVAVSTVNGATVRHAPGRISNDGATGTVITAAAETLPQWYADYPYDVRPITDDSPFFWHFARFRDAARGTSVDTPGLDMEDATGERVLMVLLAVVIVFAAVFLLLPLIAIREIWRAVPYKLPAGIYFAALGMGFMLFEISLIQKLTLFLGYPTYSLTVTLFALLISTGVGSLLSERYAHSRDRALWMLLAGLFVMMLFYQFVMPPLVNSFVGSSLALRVAMTTVFLAPLGMCLGSFMPIGLRTVAGVTEHTNEYIAWGWAVNGFFSVISSILATILSMTIGFNMMQLVAVGVYLVGILALMRVPAARS